MKRLLAIILILGLTGGCATQQSYTIPSSKSRADFLLDKETCENFSGYKGGLFDSGPLIILLPIATAFDLLEGNHQKDFQKCMIERGYKCTGWGCLDIKASDISMPQPGSQNLSHVYI